MKTTRENLVIRKIAATTLHAFDYMLRDYAGPIMDKRCDEIRRSDVLAILENGGLWQAKNPTALKVRDFIRKVFAIAILPYHDDIRENPAGVNISGALAPVSQPDGRFLRHPHEVTEVLDAIDKGNSAQLVKLAFRFVVLTAVRQQEALGARWDEVNFEKATWTIPASRMKSKDTTKGRPHTVPLSSAAVGVLTEARSLNHGSPFIFPSPANDGETMSKRTLLQALRYVKQSHKTTVHAFRKSFRTWASDNTDAPWDVLETCLAHSIGSKVERIYDRAELVEKRRPLMQAWADAIMS